MTTYTTPHSLPILEPADRIAASGDGLREDLNAISTATNAALTAVGAAANPFKGTLAVGSDAYAQLASGWVSVPTALAASQIQNLPAGAGPGILQSRRLGSGLTELRYSEVDGRFAEFKATAGPSGVVRPWVQSSGDGVQRKAYDQLTRPGNGNMVETETAVHVRFPYIQGATATRFRICLRNYNDRNNITYSGALTITGIYYGEEELTAEGGSTGRFKAEPTRITSLGSTPANGNIFGSAWVEAPLKANTRYLFAIGYTCAEGQQNHLGNGACWRTTNPADAAAVNPTGMTQSKTAPLDVFVEMEVSADVPVWAFPGDSLTVGVGATMPVFDSFVKKYALAHGAIGINMGQSGSGLNEWLTPTSWKYGKLAFTGTTPDACFVALGSNNVYAGSSLAEMKDLYASFISIAREKISPVVYAATVMPRNGVGLEAQEAVRKQYNAWLEEELPGGAQIVFDFAASVIDPSNPSRMDSRWLKTAGDTTHPGSAAYARNAAAITSPLSRPAPGSATP